MEILKKIWNFLFGSKKEEPVVLEETPAEEEPKVDRFGKPIDEDIAEDEIKKGMMSVNPRMQ